MINAGEGNPSLFYFKIARLASFLLLYKKNINIALDKSVIICYNIDMTNTELMRSILARAEKEHINLYHDVSKEEIEEYISTLKNLDELSPLFFDREMLKLFSKFKDGHTDYHLPNGFFIDKKFYLTNKKIVENGEEKLKKIVVIKDGNEFKEVKSIGGMDIKTILKELASMQAYETKEFMYYLVNKALNNPLYYYMLEIANENGGLDCVVEK